MKKRTLSLASAFLFLGIMVSSQNSGNTSTIIGNQTTEILAVVKSITSWVTGLIALVSLVQAVLIFTSSQGTGEEKMKKAGTWIFMVVFMSLGLIMARALFP